MPFKYTINEEMGIVVVKSTGEISIDNMLEEIDKAISEKRGKNIPRRLIDLSENEFNYSTEDAEKVFKALWKEARILRIDKIALLFNNIPDTFDIKKIIPFLDTSFTTIRMFVDKQKAIEFLNKDE